MLTDAVSDSNKLLDPFESRGPAGCFTGARWVGQSILNENLASCLSLLSMYPSFAWTELFVLFLNPWFVNLQSLQRDLI